MGGGSAGLTNLCSRRRLLASAARSWSGGTGTARGGCLMPPTSSWWALKIPSDTNPARVRQEAKRGAQWRLQPPIGEEIVRCNRHYWCFLSTARSDGIDINTLERS